MATQTSIVTSNRSHIILIPGFGGFDALGQVNYYAGITSLFQDWSGENHAAAVVHYFDNLPSAGVSTRAARLHVYLAKRMARGEILPDDKVVLVGHSTGGLDIRQLVCDLDEHPNDRVYADGHAYVKRREIRNRIDAAVFLSVPHWGTNIADWVHSHSVWRRAFLAEFSAAVAGSQIYLLDSVESRLVGGAAWLTDANILLAMKDALTEANENYGQPGPSRTADAQEAASELALFLRHMCSDFGAIDDLTARVYDSQKKTPAHFDEAEREEERMRWQDPAIRTLSFATIGGRPFCFPSGSAAPLWDLTRPWTYPLAGDGDASGKTDISYCLGYRACAGGPFRQLANAGRDFRVIGPEPPTPIELWDNDGIVNTASMFWPDGDMVLVMADHLDIVGHYKLRKAVGSDASRSHRKPAREYQSYDALKSTPQMTDQQFKEIWTEIFEFAVSAGAGRRQRAAAGGR